MTQPVNLGDLLDRSRPAGTTALIDCLDWERPREYSHGEIHRLANACARGPLARGLTRGDAVAILARNRAEFLVAYFGTMRAGLVSVLLTVQDVKIRVVAIGQPRELLTTLTVSGYALAGAPASKPEDKPQGPRKD